MSRLGRGFPNNALRWQLPPQTIPVTYDAVGPGISVAANSGSWSHTVGGNAALVWITVVSSSTSPTLTAQVGSTSMTLLSSLADYSTFSTGQYSSFYCFGLLNPPTGSQTVSISVTSGGTNYIGANSVSYANVLGFGTATTTTGTSTTASQTATNAANQVLAQGFGNNSGSGGFTSYNQTSRYNAAHSANSTALLIGDAATAGSVTFSATQPSATFASIVVPLV